jgi:hypothetical protein
MFVNSRLGYIIPFAFIVLQKVWQSVARPFLSFSLTYGLFYQFPVN